MAYRLGLTGSIGMGKSTTAQLFAEAGCAVWDADAAVHRLYGPGGAAVAAMVKLFPAAVQDGAVSRDILRDIISDTPAALRQIEAIVHPLVAQDRAAFIQTSDADVLVFDIPLLFETGGADHMDGVACVYIDPDEQRRRVLERGTMSAEQFEAILAKQMPIEEKMANSDWVITTDTLAHAKDQVTRILTDIRSRRDA